MVTLLSWFVLKALKHQLNTQETSGNSVVLEVQYGIHNACFQFEKLGQSVRLLGIKRLLKFYELPGNSRNFLEAVFPPDPQL